MEIPYENQNSVGFGVVSRFQNYEYSRETLRFVSTDYNLILFYNWLQDLLKELKIIRNFQMYWEKLELIKTMEGKDFPYIHQKPWTGKNSI